MPLSSWPFAQPSGQSSLNQRRVAFREPTWELPKLLGVPCWGPYEGILPFGVYIKGPRVSNPHTTTSRRPGSFFSPVSASHKRLGCRLRSQLYSVWQQGTALHSLSGTSLGTDPYTSAAYSAEEALRHDCLAEPPLWAWSSPSSEGAKKRLLDLWVLMKTTGLFWVSEVSRLHFRYR